jgi:hypothetical protein
MIGEKALKLGAPEIRKYYETRLFLYIMALTKVNFALL